MITGGSNKQRMGMRFLKISDLSTTPKPAEILDTKQDPHNRYGNTVVVKLQMEAGIFFWSLKVDKNPNLEALIAKFGRDEADWKGQALLIGLEMDEFSEQYFPVVLFPETTKITKKGKK